MSDTSIITYLIKSKELLRQLGWIDPGAISEPLNCCMLHKFVGSGNFLYLLDKRISYITSLIGICKLHIFVDFAMPFLHHFWGDGEGSTLQKPVGESNNWSKVKNF